jgi:hypothetical protein
MWTDVDAAAQAARKIEVMRVELGEEEKKMTLELGHCRLQAKPPLQ